MNSRRNDAPVCVNGLVQGLDEYETHAIPAHINGSPVEIYFFGVNDHKIDLFEGQYTVPNGMAYNSYAIVDDKIAIMDTVDRNFTHEWLDNVQSPYFSFILRSQDLDR